MRSNDLSVTVGLASGKSAERRAASADGRPGGAQVTPGASEASKETVEPEMEINIERKSSCIKSMINITKFTWSQLHTYGNV